jgi:hypothetical protein
MAYYHWTAENVALALKKVGLGKYSQVFIDQEIAGDVLDGLTTEHLREMGLTIGARIAVMQWIASVMALYPPEGADRAAGRMEDDLAPEEESDLDPAPARVRCSLSARMFAAGRMEDDLAPEEESDLDPSPARVKCSLCARMFAAERIEQHEVACATRKRRAPFDSRQMRIGHLESAPSSPDPSPEAQTLPSHRRNRFPHRGAITQGHEARCPKPKKRPVWDSKARRLSGTGADEFTREGQGTEIPKPDFRKVHATLHEVIKTAHRLAKLRRMLEAQ